ncbi:hypothetical protein KC343_g3803 [Hortaea werneckii]|uniref:Uncharacterized protein n=1 Tax=Hortaea werneckii TaxID=91943 RepID=A0A3M7F4M0_HORWE|nr:hypothetical protein KC352_g9026 [Hortaea werneckii]KAI7567082.1 hypothetical protein KC317_g5231 [Hortaea werneckii]KAI7622012.1 hypothetical protein KC346_g3414 [Hortaea werneckii]KAI7631825.1 hypothetical protein KC343_g3803 [Hortaea werneckii]KAI7676170.1 hypothetical protein KC319_g4433 [Hortaea werneckii]
MLPRPPTKITLTADDIAEYEQRKLARDAARNMNAEQRMDSSVSQDTSNSTVEDAHDNRMEQESSMVEQDATPAQQTRAARAAAAARVRSEREARLGIGSSRS